MTRPSLRRPVLGAMLLLALLVSSSWADSPTIVDEAGSPRFSASRDGRSGPSKLQQPLGFYIYGGPNTVEGRFQTGFESGAADPQGWVGADRTEVTPVWRASQTNASTLGSGANNSAVICNHDASDYFGYGNDWEEWLVFELDITQLGIDPDAGPVTVRLDFDYVHDLEDTFDFFYIERYAAGDFQVLQAVSGSSYDAGSMFYAPVSFDQSFVYNVGDYIEGSIISLRLRVTTNSVASDEDGFIDTQGRGAVAVDDIEVSVNGEIVSSADWEPLGQGIPFDHPEGDISDTNNGANTGTDGWQPTSSEFVGDFAKLFAGFQDIDPCEANLSTQFGFVDTGAPPENDPLRRTTGGSVSSTWNYGVPGSFVTNYTGGIEPDGALYNQIWSPAFDWDLPGTADDIANGGGTLSFEVWEHLPLNNGLFYQWQVRSFRTDSGWTPWRDYAVVYSGETPQYETIEIEVGPLLVTDPERVQIALGVRDLAEAFMLDGNDATPSPMFDNVSFQKTVVTGPIITAQSRDLFHDAFPAGGTINYDEDQPELLSIRLDMAQDIIGEAGPAILTGDSVAIDVVPVIPGSSLDGPPEMIWQLRTNPAFNTARAAALTSLGATNLGNGVFQGTVLGKMSTDAVGDTVEGRWFFDLPDGPANPNGPHQADEDPLFFPGDRLHYYFLARDDQGNTSTLPADLNDFDFAAPLPGPPVGCPSYDLQAYDLLFQASGLPSLWVEFTLDPPPTVTNVVQPDILLWNDFGLGDGEDFVYEQSFYQLGLYEGRDFDVYHTRAAGSGISDGLGATAGHGANAIQLKDYSIIVYVAGDRSSLLINDGTNAGGNDKSNDVEALTNWHTEFSDRHVAYFGDNVSSGMEAQGAATQNYLNSVMGVAMLSDDVRSKISGQTAPLVIPKASSGLFQGRYVAYGGCAAINTFDEIQPLGAGPVVAHEFTTPAGNSYPTSVPTSLWWSRFQDLFLKVNATFSHGFRFVRDSLNEPGNPSGATARSRLLGEVITGFGRSLGGNPTSTGALSTRRLVLDGAFPNPFNPATTIRFLAPARGRVSVRIFDLRGREVSTLLDDEVAEGPQEVRWDGRDGGGAAVSSGVYLVQVRGFGEVQAAKLALVK